VLVAVLLALGCAVSQPPGADPSVGRPARECPQDQGGAALRVLILGDSVAAADRIAVERRWSARLEELLSSTKPRLGVTVVNRAQGGSEVDLLERHAEELPLDQFDIVFVISGVNDTPARSLAGWRSRYAAVVGKLAQAGLIVIIGTPPPEYLYGAYTERYLPVVEALREIADGGPVLDLDRHWRQNVEPGALHLDWIHPNDDAQIVMARLAADLVLEPGCSTRVDPG
jgi:lysophospholipase L1-like esterase